MTPFAYSYSLPPSHDLLAPDARATPNPAQRAQAAVYERYLQSDPPGWWAANRVEQTNHYAGVVAIAAKAYMDAIGAAKFTVLERKTPGLLSKSTSGSGNYSRDDEYEPVEPGHPLAQIVEHPGGEDGVWSIQQECAYLTLQHILTGDAPAWTPVNSGGKPVRFYALTSALVDPVRAMGIDPAYPKGAYLVRPYSTGAFYMGGALATGAILPGEEVARFREYHPWARNLGMSRLQSGAKEIDVLEAITASRWAYFDGGLQLDFVAMIPGATQETIDSFKEQINQKAAGMHKSRRFIAVGGPAIPDTQWKLQQFGQTARDLDFNEGYEQSAGIALAFFRVPRGVAGFTSQSSYSQHYAELQQFWDLGINPYCRALSVFLTSALARPWNQVPGQYRIEVEARKPADVEMEAKELEFAYQNDIITKNEYRKATGRKPEADGDVTFSASKAKTAAQFAPPPAPGTPPGQMPTAGAVPKPANLDAAAGSLPPRAEKALEEEKRPAELEDAACACGRQ